MFATVGDSLPRGERHVDGGDRGREGTFEDGIAVVGVPAELGDDVHRVDVRLVTNGARVRDGFRRLVETCRVAPARVGPLEELQVLA